MQPQRLIRRHEADKCQAPRSPDTGDGRADKEEGLSKPVSHNAGGSQGPFEEGALGRGSGAVARKESSERAPSRCLEPVVKSYHKFYNDKHEERREDSAGGSGVGDRARRLSCVKILYIPRARIYQPQPTGSRQREMSNTRKDYYEG
jgi:hypothetical protein